MEDTFLEIGTTLFIHLVELNLQPSGQESLTVCEQTTNCISFVKSSVEISPITAES